MKTLKNEIKNLVEVQRELKNQRKTVNLVGDRTIEPSEAAWKHGLNRHNLRLMYAAYGVLRGKNYSQIENHYTEDEHPLKAFEADINKIVEKHAVREEALHSN